jgi:L-alanine-DL-glutamate epimerase-like enolase superfamily enzyme
LITSIETYSNQFVAVVKVVTDDGDEGWGQVAPYQADITAQVLHRHVAPHAIGQDETQLEELVAAIPEKEHKFPGSYLMRALGGLDTALWDLRGKRAGQSVCELLGGMPRAIPLYASSMRRDISPSAEASRLARLCQDDGFGAVKFRIGRECGHDQDEWPGRTEEVVPAVRRAVGDDVRLLVDANSGYTPARAIEIGRWLQDHGVVHFEEPCPYWELEWTAQVSAALDLDVTGGEQDCHMGQWRRMVELRAVDVVQPDVCYLGGLTRTLAVAELAHRAGLPCTPHSANRSMVTVFSLHLLGAIPNAGPYLEWSIEPPGYYAWADDLLAEPLVARDGAVEIPTGPGWGVDIAPAWLAAAEHHVSDLDTPAPAMGWG